MEESLQHVPEHLVPNDHPFLQHEDHDLDHVPHIVHYFNPKHQIFGAQQQRQHLAELLDKHHADGTSTQASERSAESSTVPSTMNPSSSSLPNLHRLSHTTIWERLFHCPHNSRMNLKSSIPTISNWFSNSIWKTNMNNVMTTVMKPVHHITFIIWQTMPISI